MATDIESISFVHIGSANAANPLGVGFKDDDGMVVLGQFVSGGETGGAAAGNHGLERFDPRHVVGIGYIDPSPAVRPGPWCSRFGGNDGSGFRGRFGFGG